MNSFASLSFVSMSLALVCCLGLSPLHAQMNNRLDSPSSAMPESERPAELKDARDTLTADGQALRLRADVWVKVAPCPNTKPRDNCFKPASSGGRLFMALWGETAMTGFEIEKVWLLRKGEIWSTTELRKQPDNKLEFSGGPAWKPHEPVDVVVKVRGVNELLQTRFKTLYPVSG